MNPSALIDKAIADHADWRGQTMADIRRVIRETVPDVTEEWKWMGTPTWSHNGILCICNAFKDMVKVTFINGAQLGDVKGVFNAELHKERRRGVPGSRRRSNAWRFEPSCIIRRSVARGVIC
jgi:hypothetical protein